MVTFRWILLLSALMTLGNLAHARGGKYYSYQCTVASKHTDGDVSHNQGLNNLMSTTSAWLLIGSRSMVYLYDSNDQAIGLPVQSDGSVAMANGINMFFPQASGSARSGETGWGNNSVILESTGNFFDLSANLRRVRAGAQRMAYRINSVDNTVLFLDCQR